MRDLRIEELDVSRETIEQLVRFEALVLQWTGRINLIAANDRDDIWSRHVADSAQLAIMHPFGAHLVDLGSGGGFPGLVLAIIGRETSPDTRFTLIESDRRKAVFLETVVRELELGATVLAERIEDVPGLGADVVTARALAPLEKLLPPVAKHLAPDGSALLPKGRNWKNECSNAREKWSFRCDVVRSLTDTEAVVLKLDNIGKK